MYERWNNSGLGFYARFKIKLAEVGKNIGIISVFVAVANYMLATSWGLSRVAEVATYIVLSVIMLVMLAVLFSSYFAMILGAFAISYLVVALKINTFLGFLEVNIYTITMALAMILAIISGTALELYIEEPRKGFWWLPSPLAEIEEKITKKLEQTILELFKKLRAW